MNRAISRLALSGALSAVLIAVFSRLPHLNDATAALLMVLCILGISIKWGWAEALTAAIVGGGCFDYYFLGPPGFTITAPEYGVNIAAFLITAIITGQLVARLRRRQIEAMALHAEADKLVKLGNAMLSETGAEFSLRRLADTLAEIFEADGVAFYEESSGRIVRSGEHSGVISEQALHETATCGLRLLDAGSAFALTPIRNGGDLIGSIGMSGADLSESLLCAISEKVGLGLARLNAIEKTDEAELARRAQELKSAVLDAMAHDIRNPLNSIKIAATILRSEHSDRKISNEDLFAIIDEEVQRLDHFLDDALRMGREDAAQLRLNKEPQSIAHLIPAAIEELGAPALRRLIQVSVPEELPAAECDKEMVVRVLKQLLNNALKYSPADTPLKVSAQFTGKVIVIDVIDGGPGVHDDERDRIFEKYYRGRATRAFTPGTGLGLSSARMIVQAHGGEIWMTSPRSGGAAFHVSLPVFYDPALNRADGTTVPSFSSQLQRSITPTNMSLDTTTPVTA